ncbi:MAG TPA: hypothetical protein VMU67_11260 [Steroidobacteraceae bacterium]|nr:hypothetical protein [Steroidobacteraceae bacterium]
MSNRRAFLNGAGAVGALAFATAGLPRALARASADHDQARAVPRSSPMHSADADPWDVDDICGPTPRYALATPHAPVRTSPVLWEHVDPIDRMLVI